MTTLSFGQDHISLNFAQTYAKFRFIDSQGEKNENINTDIRYSYGINYTKVFDLGFFVRPEIGYKHLGALSVLGENQKLTWNLHYADINLGGGYIFQPFQIQPYVGASIYYSYLFKADQTIGSSYYNLMDADELKKSDVGVNLFAGIIYAFNKSNMVFFEIRNSTGLMQIEKNIDDAQNQKMYNRAFSLSFGLSFKINKTESSSSF